MHYIQGNNREQAILFPQSLDQIIRADNEVRIIDLFVYGYLNSIRSSRTLEKECLRNIELMWLMKQLAPDHNTISNFRRDNDKAIRKVFRHTVSIAQQFHLIGGKLIARDSNKLMAQNSKKNNFNEGKWIFHSIVYHLFQMIVYQEFSPKFTTLSAV